MRKDLQNIAKKEHFLGVSILAANCHFQGRMICKGVSRIAGTVQGEIQSEGLLIIESGAKVDGLVEADEIVVQGNLSGKTVVSKRVEFTATGKFKGEIYTPNLYVTEGAKINGQLTMVDLERDLVRDSREIEKLDVDLDATDEPDGKIADDSAPEIELQK